MSAYRPGDQYTGQFVTQRFDSGVATDADALPVATATRNGADDAGFALVVEKLATGRYAVTGQVPAGYAAGDAVQISVAATVNGVAGAAVIDSFVVDAVRMADLPQAADYTPERAEALDNLDATVGSRAAAADYTPERAEALDNLDATVSSRLPAADYVPDIGAGADAVTLTIRTTGGTAIPDADVWVTSDEAGSHVVAGTRQTDSNGRVTFLLDAGAAYYLWRQKDGYQFPNPTAFTAVAD